MDCAQAKKQMQQRAQKLELLQQYNNKTDVEKILAKYPQATAFLPMKANAVDMTVLIRCQRASGKNCRLTPMMALNH